jgi:hypothetical protein
MTVRKKERRKDTQLEKNFKYGNSMPGLSTITMNVNV